MRRPNRTKSMTSVREVPGRREAAKEEKRARLVEAAWELFSERGVSATTTADIATRAGIAKGTVFLYATDKDDLVFLVMHDRLAAVSDECLRTAPKRGPLLAQLQHVFGGLYALYARSGELGRHLVRLLPGATGENAKRVNALTFAFVHRLAALVIEAQARGEVRADVDPMVAATTCFSLYFSGLMAWLQGFATLEEAGERLVPQALALLERGLHADGAPRR
ncbi:MAG: TetR/AcrR family transcriptional regulator [Myxococcaceae bacterium]|nr:TetR/AcrR family transcriptional regulator [Myxococcaceae bacterium]